jgi:CheY-like chemotaxis protein
VGRLASHALRRAPAALAFSIIDTGIGIPKDKQQLIFEAFQQADASTSRVYGGTGLGLTISRELSRILGGEIHLASTPGVGSTFTLYLPVSPEDRAPPARAAGDEIGGYEEAHTVTAAPLVRALEEPSASPAPGTQSLAGKKVLVVDDDVRNLFAVTSLLERHGAHVVAASSARECFDALEKHPDIAVVLLDMMMPEVDGYEAARHIRRELRYKDLPLIALTAKAMPGDREKTLDAGCDDFVPKPVEQERLIAVLDEWTRPERKAREAGT